MAAARMSLTVVNVAYPFAPVSASTAGGAEQVIAAIDRELVARGHRSIVIACEGSRVCGELVATPRFARDLEHASRDAHAQAIARVLAREAVDVVHLHGSDFDRYLPDVPAIVTVHLPPSWYPPEALRRDDVTYVCVSETERREFPGAAIVIGNGVDLDALHPSEGHESFVCLGRVCAEKGFHDAVDAAKRADANLLIAGELFAYAEHERYWRETLAPKLDARRRFIGPVAMPHKRELLAGARAVLIPSRVAETSSLVAMEALACGTPVIAYRSGALPEIVDDGVTGFVVDDVDGLVRAIARIGEIDRARCRAAAQQRFDSRAMTERYLALYAAFACARSSSSPR